MPDIIRSEDNGNGNGGTDAYLNTGSAWLQSGVWIPTISFNGDNNIYSWGSHLLDLNADGLPDIIRKQDTFFGVQLNIGIAFGPETSSSWNPGPNIEYLTGPFAQFADVNNDGLPDIIYTIYDTFYAQYNRYVYLNKGDGTWVSDSSYLPSINLVDTANNDAGWRFFEVNGDGLVDLVPDYSTMSAGATTYLNTGSGWTASSAWNVPSDGNIEFNTGPVSIVDVNTDGTLDFMYTQGSNPMTTNVYKNKTTTPTDTLKKITFPQGGETTVTYKRTPNYLNGSTILNPSFPIPLDTVYQTSTVDGNGVTSTETFTYEGGLYSYSAWNDRKPAGFSKVTKVDTAGNKTINYYHQGNSTNSSQGEYDDHVSKIGKIYRTEITDSSGNIYEKTINKWDKYNLGTGRDFVKLVRTTILTYDGDSDHKDKTEEYTYDNTYGNLTQKVMWGEVTASDDGSYTDTGSDKFTENILYVANVGNYVVGLPYQDTVVNQSSNKVRESKIYYDTLPLGSVGAGNETKVEKWKTSSAYVNTQKSYNLAYGVVTSSIDERGKITSYTLDPYYLYPATITNPLSQATGYTYDYSAGKAKKVTDPNNFIYQITFDGLDRVIEEKVPDLSAPYSPLTKTTYAYTDTSGSVNILRTDHLDSSTSVLTYQYFDGLNRPIQERSEAEESGNYNAQDIVYNNIGLVNKESLPYTSSGSAKTAATSTTALYTTYSYDPIKRITNVANAVGITSNTYDDWKTSITDPRGKVKHLYNDAYGNLTRVDEINSGNTYSTYYEWNGNKKLTKITDALSNLRNFIYDGLGRRVAAEDLHASGDGSYGIWVYTYDDAGNLTQTVDSKSQTVNYTYNDINQVLTENYTGGSGTEVSYTYGGCANGVGKLCNVDTTEAIDSDFTYNSNGAPASEIKTINSVGYATSYLYDRQGNYAEITSPDNSKVKYTYNTAGLLEKIERKESTDGSFIEVVSNYTYGPQRKVTKQENGNSTETIYTYDADKIYRLTRLLTNNLAGTGGEEDIGLIDETPTPIDETKLPGENEKFTEKGVYKLLEKDESGREIIEAKIFSGPVNYFDDMRDIWRRIDSKPKDKVKNWQIDEAPYKASIEKELTADSFLSFANGSNTINFSLANPPATPIAGQALAEEPKIIYAGALGQNLDLEITALPGLVRQEAVIRSLPELSGEEFYEIPFKITSDTGMVLTDAEGNMLTKENPLATAGEVKLINAEDNTETYFWAPRATDNEGRSIPINTRYEEKEDGVYFSKLLPTEWLSEAVYPIVTDTVVSYYGGLGDGYIWKNANTWDIAHNATAGTPNASWTTAVVESNKPYGWSSEIEIARIALPIDTSELPDDAEISSAKLKVYVTGTADNDDDGNDFIRVVQNTTASNTSLVGEDYDQIGAIDNPPAGATDKDLTPMGTGWQPFILNATGIGWINKTDYTKLGFREGHDVVDEMITLYSNRMIINTGNSGNPPYLEITYTIPNQAPTAPTNLKTEGAINPIDVLDTTPEFTALYNDPNPNDTAPFYQIQVSTSNDFTSPLWDSGKMAFGVPVNQGSQSPEVSYGGAPLALNGATHYWRIKFWDAADAEGAWSTVTATFKMYDATIEVLQDLNFTYDNNGNITQIVDASETDTAKTVAYVYDDLNRLTSAIATDVASGQSTYSPAFAYNVFETATSTNPASRQLTYTHIFAYNAIGNFINKSDVGNYSYAGTNYANPHAATSINNITQTYDNNGNLTGDGTWTHTWDYKNRLIQSTKTGTTAIYAYDQNGARAKFYNGTTMIITASPYYSKEGSLDVKYIYVGDKIVATVRGTGASAAVYYMHTDHLGSSAVVTNNDGEVRELSDYFAYGEQRIHETVNFDDRKGYIGKDYDTATTLSQLEARYYRSKQGRFISEDPMFWSLPAVLLVDPQQQNSYSYGRDNPITNSDPSGRMTIKQMAQTFINSVNSIFGRSTPTIQSQAVQAENSKTNANVGNSPTVLNSPVGNASITSSFGSDRSDCSVCSKIHGGTDYGVRVGTPVYATAPGTVVRSDWSNSLGNTVVIEHLKLSTRNDGVYTLYGHGSSLSVESGQPVNTGDIIMYSGNTGKSTGAHLHYEVIKSPFQFGSNSFYADKPNYTFGPEALSGFLAK